MFEIVVTNIGNVYTGRSADQARQVFNTYVQRSTDDEGRAAGESVYMFRDADIEDEFIGSLRRDGDD